MSNDAQKLDQVSTGEQDYLTIIVRQTLARARQSHAMMSLMMLEIMVVLIMLMIMMIIINNDSDYTNDHDYGDYCYSDVHNYGDVDDRE